MRAPIQLPKTLYSFFAFKGGLDQVTPPIELDGGVLRTASNVEIGLNGGYRRVAGYERYSGKARPSDAAYAILECNITGSVALGDVLTDATAAAYGTVIALPTGQAVLTLVTGTFAVGDIKVGATVVGTCSAAQTAGSASTAALNATYLNLAADVYRALIGAVPGSGSVLGIHQYNGDKYAFRNNAGGTAAVMHKQSASGWTEVALGREISFTSGGTTEIVVGNTITGATSGATAVITKVILTSGTWAGGDAAGRLFFASQTGTFQAENLNVGASLNLATIAGDSTAITLSPSGRYEFFNWNFGGQAGAKKMYGVDGVNKGFEFDGTVFVKINTGMTADAPTHVWVHKNHLFYSFGGSAQHSGTANPYSWTLLTGASELACGDTIKGFLGLTGTQSGAALAMYTSNRTLILYGNDSTDWNLVPLSEEAGAKEWTVQYIGNGIGLDSQGITSLATTQNYGNFQNAVLSDKIAPTLQEIINNATASCISRKKNQYRLFFSGGTAIYVTFKNGKILGMTPIAFPDTVSCISSEESTTGVEEIYFGSTDGFVYQMDVGTSFDGDSIAWLAELAFNHIGTPRQLKTFRKAVLELTGDAYCEFTFGYALSYGSEEFDASINTRFSAQLSGTRWDEFTWDQFFWDGRSLTPSEADIAGTAENISLVFSGDSDEFQPFTLNSAIIHYSPRRGMR